MVAFNSAITPNDLRRAPVPGRSRDENPGACEYLAPRGQTYLAAPGDGRSPKKMSRISSKRSALQPFWRELLSLPYINEELID
jgi:hypothetical protein